ncbi:hypothetical protein N7451_012412 [Penicillium sp. IBT 35674x]|nr:hypothetical protein N7451_012412 [Penicillium sp. IBT 35674x]
MLHLAAVPSGTVPNKADSQQAFISVEEGVTTVLPLGKVTSLQISDYHLGISYATDGKDRKLVILGLPGKKKISRVREMVLHFWKSIPETPLLALSIEGTDLMMEAMRTGRNTTKAYICIGLPAITFGPLFNTLVSACNANAGCFDLSIGYIWMAAAIDLTRLEIEGEEVSGAFGNLFLSMINDQSQRSWLVEAKLQFWLESTFRMRASVLAELLEMSGIRITSTHRPTARS